MNWHVIVRPRVSQAIGQSGLSRLGVVRLPARLHIFLPAQADRLRLNRDAVDPSFFLYHVGFWDGSAWQSFEFRVDDSTAPAFLFVEEMRRFVP